MTLPTPGATARRMFGLVEPIGLIPYATDEPAEALMALGLRSYWDTYFAGRAAPLGLATAAVVDALFYNFAPGEVARHIPKVWRTTTPEAAIAARQIGSVRALRRILSDHVDSPAFARATELLLKAAISAPYEGRPMYAALRATPIPDDVVARFFHAGSLLREHRGDGHVLAGVAHGLRGLDATVTFAATGAISRAMVQPTRGWTDEDWAQSVRRLQAKGLLDSGERLTKTGGALSRDVEDLTDRLAAGLTLIRSVAAGAEMRSGGRGWPGTEVWPGAEVRTEAGLRDYIRHTVSSYFHPAGTCRMGSGPDAVVDLDLRVHGISGLRIADASVMPSIPGGNTNAPAMMIGEHAARLMAAGS